MADTVPEQPGLTRRLMSMLYESLLLAAVLFFAALFATLAVTPAADALHPGFRGYAHAVFQVYLLTVVGLYFGWFWSHGGQTLAMKTWGLRVEREDGEPLQFLQALLRFALAVAGIGLFGIGILWALFDRDRQFLHDRLAKTRIVRVRYPKKAASRT